MIYNTTLDLTAAINDLAAEGTQARHHRDLTRAVPQPGVNLSCLSHQPISVDFSAPGPGTRRHRTQQDRPLTSGSHQGPIVLVTRRCPRQDSYSICTNPYPP